MRASGDTTRENFRSRRRFQSCPSPFATKSSISMPFSFAREDFSQLGLTFEQFLLVINAIMPGELSGDN